jgi:DNA modification methylase
MILGNIIRVKETITLTNQIVCSDSLEFMKEQADYSTDIIYADVPYGLGSEVIIRPDGKPDYEKSADFMNKWDMPTGDYWEKWFKEAFRTLKYGGYCIMFGMDRQCLIPKYYANLAGFSERQSCYWYFISNFPKSSDLSKNIDKHFGAERNVVNIKKHAKNDFSNNLYAQDEANKNNEKVFGYGDENITIPSTPLAKKYDGYKYSISPLKQTNETILIFQKPYKSGSCLHDTLAMENGDKECCCGALDIDGGRVPIVGERNPTGSAKRVFKSNQYTDEKIYGDNTETSPSGRYHAQTFIDSQSAVVLDEQSGVKKPSGSVKGTEPSKTGTENCYGLYDRVSFNAHQDIGGVSKILHKCDFEAGEHDLYFYCIKVNKSERNAGLDGFDENIPMYEQYHRKNAQTTKGIETPYAGAGRGGGDLRNNHPTLKPISLNTRILKLFKTPNPQRILFPFAGAGSEIIGGIKAGFTDWQGCEISQDYIDIANARIKYWIEQNDLQGSLFNLNDDDMKPIEQESSQDDLFKEDEC